MSNQNQSCANCRYFHVMPQANACRRFPPTPVPDTFTYEDEHSRQHAGTEVETKFPAVLGSDWCGEYASQLFVPPSKRP